MPSFGEELRRERELRRIALREVAEATKVSLRYLEALESNDFEHLPGGVFNRGFVRAYSQYIGIDPDAMVDAYLLEEQAQATLGKARDRDFFHRPRRSKKTTEAGEGQQSMPLVGPFVRWLLVVLVLGAVLYGAFLIYVNWNNGNDAPAQSTSSQNAGSE
jgi:cytoskeletal protein RodZ